MKALVLAIVALTFLGCSTKNPSAANYINLTPYTTQTAQEVPYKLKNENPVTLTIYEQYKKWYSTPYLYGGDSCEGIDCSALVQTVYQDGFGLHIPRDTKHQAQTGYFVNKSSIQEGDLLLFKTGYNSRHSGIYIERGNFLHTSTKHGVMISNINNPYWKEKYWQARRVLSY
ncbi:NlpC/P60 family protein [Sulfurimonas sp. C5]|uniref:NlpC/P60 family protein n=1 Tax=Sulfurimonas sp. C5 TaxID=3036947 RepID=UPI002456C563|nr:NlpC/P60 family protein [Sulfurimonas sp. C5]MDH4944627.1 NlpC/P60 family protein [Sulfurimonas sp. C5]